MNKELQGKGDDFSRRLEESEAKVSTLQTEYEGATGRIMTLERQNGELKGKGENVVKLLGESEELVSLLRSERDAATTRVTCLERENNDATEHLDTSRSAVSRLESNRINLIDKVKQAELLEEELRRNNAESSARVTT